LYDILNDYNYCRLYYSINVTKWIKQFYFQ
jgi:hypothetical protein